jgi:hypothetical protein
LAKHNIELALLLLDLREKSIKIVKVRDVALYPGDVSSYLPYRSSQLRITASGYEDIRAFIHKALRGRKTNAASATSNECEFSIKFAHVFLLVRSLMNLRTVSGFDAIKLLG